METQSKDVLMMCDLNTAEEFRTHDIKRNEFDYIFTIRRIVLFESARFYSRFQQDQRNVITG